MAKAIKLKPFKIMFTSILLSTTLCISGCWNNLEVNNTCVPIGLVYEKQQDELWFGVQLAQPSKGESGQTQAPKQYINVQSSGNTFAEAARNISLRLPRVPVWSHISVIVLGSKLAGSDLAFFADDVARNRNVRKTADIFVCADPNAEKCMDAEVPLQPYPLLSLKRIIRVQEEQAGIFAPVQLEEFLAKLSTPGVDPVAPRFSVKEEKGKLLYELDGMAVFAQRKMVGYLNKDESRGYRYLRSGMTTNGLITIASPLNPDRFVSLEVIRLQVKSQPVISADNITMNITIHAEGNFYDQTCTGQLLTPDQFKVIDNAAEKRITEFINAAITKAQALGSDIFGWGQLIQRTHTEDWSKLEQDWPEHFKNINPNITVDFKIRRTYLLDESFQFR